MASSKNRDKGDGPRIVTSVLRLKLGACLTAPTRRLFIDLADAARMYNVARNAMMRAWEQFWLSRPHLHGRGNPASAGFEVPDPRGPDPRKLPLDRAFGARRTVSQSSWLYGVGTGASPNLATVIVSAGAQDVLSNMGTENAHPRPGGCRFRWQAVLGCHVARPTFRETVLPVVCNSSAVCYMGKVATARKGGHFAGGPTRSKLLVGGASGCVLAFPAWSRESGRRWLHHVVRLEAGQLGEGHKAALRALCEGREGWKFSDSELVFRPGPPGRRSRAPAWRDGEWFLHLCYQMPGGASSLDPCRVAAVTPQEGGASGPFVVGCEGDDAPWVVGAYPVLQVMQRRIDARRGALRQRRKLRGNTGGHGRQRALRDDKAMTRTAQDLAGDACKKMVSEVVRYCRRRGCGAVAYAEPALPWRPRSWFAARGLPWDWTSFRARLRHKCDLEGIRFQEAP